LIGGRRTLVFLALLFGIVIAWNVSQSLRAPLDDPKAEEDRARYAASVPAAMIIGAPFILLGILSLALNCNCPQEQAELRTALERSAVRAARPVPPTVRAGVAATTENVMLELRPGTLTEPFTRG